MNQYAELLAILESDASNRSIEISGKRREIIIDALRIASIYVPLPAIPHATDNEKRIVGRLVTDLIAAGAQLSVNDGEEVTVMRSTDADKIFVALSSTGEDYLMVDFPATGPRQRWVRLIWGNDVDVISDYHTSLEPFLAGANALASELDS